MQRVNRDLSCRLLPHAIHDTVMLVLVHYSCPLSALAQSPLHVNDLFYDPAYICFPLPLFGPLHRPPMHSLSVHQGTLTSGFLCDQTVRLPLIPIFLLLLFLDLYTSLYPLSALHFIGSPLLIVLSSRCSIRLATARYCTYLMTAGRHGC